MKKYPLVILLFFACSCGHSQVKEAVNAQVTQPGKISKQQTDLIFDMIKVFPDQTQFSIAFIKNGNVHFYGVKRVNDSITAVDNARNVFEIGSITKVFTSTLLAYAVTEGKVKLDDTISDRLGFPLRNAVEISYTQLANHTSGLPRMPSNFNFSAMLSPSNPYKNYNNADLESFLKNEMKVMQNPGEKYDYSNVGAGTLGYVLCKIANADFQTLADQKIFSPYGMTNTTTVRSTIENRLVSGLNAQGEVTSNWDLGALTGAGGILSTVEDLSRFAQAQFDSTHTALTLTRTSTFRVNDHLEVGLGWHILHAETGDTWHWHNGGTGGYTSSMAIDVKNKTGIVILTNVSAFHKNMKNIDNLCFELMKGLAAMNTEVLKH